MAHGVEQSDAADRLAAAIAAHDPTFEGSAAHLQTQIGAAWTIAQMLQLDSDLAVTAALAVCSANFCALEPAGAELYSMAVETLGEHQIAARRRPELVKAKRNQSVAGDELAAVGAITGEQAKAIADALTKQINALVAIQVGMTDALTSRLQAADEEINALWWTIGGRQGGDGATWNELGCAAGILAGRDMALMTPFSTPPRWANALFSIALANVGDCTIEEAVNALPEPLAAGEAPKHRLLPISSAAGGETPHFGLDNRRETARKLAEQTLTESLLERVL